jgi:hypothetical protein
MTAYGLMRKRPDQRDYVFAPPDRWDGTTKADLSGLFPEPPYDQGQLGSCVSQGTAGCADFARVRMGLAKGDPYITGPRGWMHYPRMTGNTKAVRSPLAEIFAATPEG